MTCVSFSDLLTLLNRHSDPIDDCDDCKKSMCTGCTEDMVQEVVDLWKPSQPLFHNWTIEYEFCPSKDIGFSVYVCDSDGDAHCECVFWKEATWVMNYGYPIAEPGVWECMDEEEQLLKKKEVHCLCVS